MWVCPIHVFTGDEQAHAALHDPASSRRVATDAPDRGQPRLSLAPRRLQTGARPHRNGVTSRVTSHCLLTFE